MQEIKYFIKTYLYMADEDFEDHLTEAKNFFKDLYDEEISDDRARDIVFDWISDDYSLFMAEVKNHDFYYSKFVVDANLGLWFGDVEASGEFDSLDKAIEACVDGAWDFQIYEDSNGDLNIESAHHDGRNYFTIRRVDDFDTDLDLREVKPIHLWKELYGA